MARKITFLTGLTASVLLVAPLLALLYLAHRLFSVPFPPFDLFDLFARVLPGELVTFGIDLMVDTILLFDLGPTDRAALAAEQIMATLLLAVLGIVAGTIYFVVVRERLTDRVTLNRDGLISGLILGVSFGLPVTLIVMAENTSAAASPALSMVWMLFAFSLWGIGHGAVYGRLAGAVFDSADESAVSATVIDRRQFLVQVGAATATITVVGAGLSAFLGGDQTSSDPVSDGLAAESGGDATSTIQLPNADDPLVPAPGTRDEYTALADHYRIDISTIPPRIQEDDYALPIYGLVENPAELTLQQIRDDFESMDQFITMACISNRIAGDLISTIMWTGVSMQKILELVQPSPEATHIKITGADNFDEILALDLIREDETVMLCYAWDNQPLPQRNGFPLRIHIPDRFGMKQPKWITSMEFIGEWEPGYWVRRGWSEEAMVVATSVVDTVAVDDVYTADDGGMRVPVGGIAWAGVRGISKVEVQVDDGEWQEAELRTPMSDRSWTIWRYDWPFQEGSHTFAVRCVEGDGTPQIESVRGVRPDGATGIHSRNASL